MKFPTRTLIAAAVFSLAGSALAQGKEIVIWHAYRAAEKAAFEKVLEQFAKSPAAKGMKVSALAIPYDAYADKISAAVPRGKGPDVFIYAQDRLGGWIEAGKTVESIDFFVDKATRDRLLPGMIDAMTYKGSVWGLPINYKMPTLIYNKDLVKAPPKTTGEMVKLAKSLTNTGSGRYGLAYWYTNFYFHSALMNAFGGAVFDKDGKLTINSPATVASLNQMMTWYKTDGIMPTEPSEALIASMFNEGKAAMVINGPWFVGDIDKKINVGFATLPVVDASKKAMRPWMTIEGAYIAASSAHKDVAYELVKHLTSEEAGLVLATEGRQLHTNKAIYSNPKVSGDPVLKAFREQLDEAEPMPNRPEMTMVWSPATTAMNKIVKGNASVDAALKEAAGSIQESISALRKGK
ncbi:MAG: extracellular solute-binding protein [Burkholderiales bacterium]|jgi:arabinogalactan oligomer/maltooligosaccharide transport system substrate-binding protein|nr:extracellular solute-binding protein [Burkholderiales bacterium]MBP7520447.1 extracellular solute-binding protein [Leptothrix sp. (in: b-proteobacteria)]